MNEVALNRLETEVKTKLGVEHVHVVNLESFYKHLTFKQQNEPGFLASDSIALYHDGKSDSLLMGVAPLLSDRAVDWFIMNRLR